MQSAWELGEDKILSSYRSNTLKPIILKHYKKKPKYIRKTFRVTAYVNFHHVTQASDH